VSYRPDLVPEKYPVHEIFGYPPECDTPEARDAREHRRCPFKGGECTKLKQAARTAICSVRYKAEGFESETAWATCANRLAAELPGVIPLAFPDRAADARLVREVKIKDPALSFDGVVVVVEPDGTVEFAGIEAQAIDTRGGAVHPLWQAYADGAPDNWASYYQGKRPTFGVNSANVWKRLLPQIINKGRMYVDWETKLYVIVQGTLLQFIRRRMHMNELSRQEHKSAEIVWLPWDYTGGYLADGQRETMVGEPIHTTLQQVEDAFTTVAAAQRPVFVAKVLSKLGRDDAAVRAAARRVEQEAKDQADLLDVDANVDVDLK
jgi:hypothetical protein